MKLIITRHGETEENKVGVVQGHLPGTLSTEGINQAKKVALRLKEEKIDFIYSSDLARAADTTKEIAKYHSNVSVEYVTKLRERYLGEFQGRNKRDIISAANNQNIDQIEPIDGETIEELCWRAESFLDETIAKHPNDSVLFVCHHNISQALIAVISGKTFSEVRATEKMYNTSISIFNIDENKNHEVLCFNCIKHLEQE